MVEISRGLRVALIGAGVAVAYAALLLLVFPGDTADLFAWDIQPAVTAAFMGACYAVAVPALFLLGRKGTPWWKVRPILPTLFVLSTTMLIATALHRDRFIWSNAITWAWLILYVLYPVAIVALYVSHQRRGPDRPPVKQPVRGWFRSGALAVAAGGGTLGLLLFVAPTRFGSLWPWTLTPLTGRVVGGWLLFFAAAALLVGREPDWAAIRPIFLESTLVLLLLLTGVARFSDSFDWGRPATWAYVAFVVGGPFASVFVFLTHERADGHGRSSVP